MDEKPVGPLRGEVAVVTGASSGQGAATALALAEQGAAVLTVARREARLRDLVARIADAGGRAALCAVDVASEGAASSIVAAAHASLGRVSILVNCAGTGDWTSVRHADPGEWAREMDVNALAPMHLAKALQSDLIATRGHIVNVSSLASRRGLVEGAGYSASKSALDRFSESLLGEFRDDGVRVTVIHTGEVATEMQTEEDIARIAMLTSDDVARSIAFAVAQPPTVNITAISLVAGHPPE